MNKQPTILIAVADKDFCRRTAAILQDFGVIEAHEISVALDILRKTPSLELVIIAEPDFIRAVKANTELAKIIAAPKNTSADVDADYFETDEPRNLISFVKSVLSCQTSENEARQRDERFQALLQTTNQIVWTTSENGDALNALSEWWEKTTGFDRNARQDRNWLEDLHPQDQAQARLDWNTAVESQSQYRTEYRVKSLDGDFRSLQVRGVPIFNRDKTLREWVGTAVDATEKYRAEAALSQQTALIELSLEPIFVWDFESGIVNWNRGCEEIYGFEKAEAIGAVSHELLQTIHPVSLADHLQTLADTGKWSGELHQFTRDGRELIVESRQMLVVMADGKRLVLESNRDVTARKRAETAARERENMIGAINDAAPTMIVVYNFADGKILYVNNWVRKMLGDAPNDVIGLAHREWSSRLHEDDAANVVLQAKKMRRAKDNEVLSHEFRGRHKNGEWRVIRSHDIIFKRGADNLPTQILSVLEDITAYRAAEQNLRNSEERLRLAAEIAAIGTWDYNFAEDKLTWSSNHFTVLGYEPNESGEASLEMFESRVHPLDVAGVMEQFYSSMQTRTTYQKDYRIVRGDTLETRWLSARGRFFYDENGAVRRSVGAFVDVTEQKIAEQKMNLANERFSIAEEAANGFLYDWNVVSGGVERSATVTKVLGYELDEIGNSGAEWSNFVHPADIEAALEKFYKAVEKGDRFSIEYRVRHKNGNYVHVLDKGIVFRDENGEAVRVIGTTQDVSERRELLERAENARREAEFANRAKDEFLAVLSHELRTPLNAMYGWIRMMASETLDAAMQKRAIEVIERNINLQSKLIEDILDVSRIVSGKITLEPIKIDLIKLVASAAETARPTASLKQISISTAFETEKISVLADAERLQQVLSNLIGNAVKFTAPGGEIKINLEQSETVARIKIKDSGVGIDADFLPHVFDRFRQADASSKRKHGGLGLGLAIVKHLIELHDGRVWAESAGENQGSTFIIELPSSLTNSAETQNLIDESVTNSVALENLQILLVEDDADAAEMLKTMLESNGAQIVAARSGLEALKILSEETAFDLVISDIAMPEMDGVELIRILRGDPKLKDLSSIALTAYASTLDRQNFLAAGFDVCLSKPLNFDELQNAVAALLKK